MNAIVISAMVLIGKNLLSKNRKYLKIHLTTIVPIFLSWDKGKLFPHRQPPLDIGSEVVVKYAF